MSRLRNFEAEVAWTANDLDTLRHEAWHMIQDCRDGVRGDAELSPMQYTQEYVRQLVELAEVVLGADKVESIIRGYSANGLGHRDITMEIEAFTSAAILSAGDIETQLRLACGLTPPGSGSHLNNWHKPVDFPPHPLYIKRVKERHP